MSVLRLLAASLLVLGLVSVATAEDKKAEISKEKLVGTWEVVKSEDDAPPVGATIEITKDGKTKISAKDASHDGTYTLAGDKLTVVMKIEDKEVKHTATIKKLTDTEMVAENEKGKMVEFKKKK